MGPVGRGLKGGFSNDEEGKEVEEYDEEGKEVEEYDEEGKEVEEAKSEDISSKWGF